MDIIRMAITDKVLLKTPTVKYTKIQVQNMIQKDMTETDMIQGYDREGYNIGGFNREGTYRKLELRS